MFDKMSIEIIGTSHIAEQSINEIKEKIENKKPEIVCVELDLSRFHSIINKNTKTDIKKSIVRLGIFGFLFSFIGKWIQKKLGEKVGINPGSDMKQAIISAKKVGSKVYLIDQPIQITLKKLSRISIWEKIKFVIYLLLSSTSKKHKNLKKIDLTKIPSKKIIKTLLKDLAEKTPEIYRVLISDRNKYMIKRLKAIEKKHPNKKIVTVVGAGHIDGLKTLRNKQGVS